MGELKYISVNSVYSVLAFKTDNDCFSAIFVVQSLGFNLCNVLHSLLSQWICWQTVSGSLHWNARCKSRVLSLRWQGNGSGPGIMRRAGSQPPALTGSCWRAGRKNPSDAETGSGFFPPFLMCLLSLVVGGTEMQTYKLNEATHSTSFYVLYSMLLGSKVFGYYFSLVGLNTLYISQT